MTTLDDQSTVEEERGSGGHSLAGYEYQIAVSIWLALDLLLVSARALEMVLEPASEEDLEAELGEFEPGRVVSRVPIENYTLIVQVKRRTTDAWNVTSLRSLLKHGSDTRESAIRRLQQSKARYLLVTSAAVNNSAARKLVVRRADVWPKGGLLPTSIASLLPANAPGRIAVIANEDDERLRSDIDRLLSEGCRVPRSRLEECRDALYKEARKRVLGAHGGRWRREEIEVIIHEHEGYLASSPELENYVHPTNWADLRTAMRERHAAVIIGKSGTGKTLATKQLYQELREEVPGLSRVPIARGPNQLQSDTTPSPLIFDLEDPWGRFDFDPNSRPWNDQLAHFLASAREDRMIIVTSRFDVAQASSALTSVKPWIVALESEHYGPRQRSALYRTRITSLPRDLQPLAQGAERQVLEQLETPLEIQKFFDALLTLDRDGLGNPPGFIGDAIGQAHEQAIERTVCNQIEARSDIAAATVVWAMLRANEKVTRTLLRDIEDDLSDRNALGERGLSPLVDFFVAARNLRQNDSGLISYYHPRVEKGIEGALKQQRPLVRSTLRHLLDVLTSPQGPGTEWGTGTAVRLIAAANRDFAIRLSTEAAALVDQWLAAQAADPDQPMERTLELAAAAGSVQSNAGELARFLLHRPDKSFGGFQRWGAPERPAAWYDARKADEGTKPLIERFIREVLPSDNNDYGDDLPDVLNKFGSKFAPAFLDAAVRVVDWGYIPTDDVIAAGALQDIEGFEAIVDLAVEALTPTQEDKKHDAEVHLEIINGVHSEDYAQHLGENDDGFTAREFLSAYVHARRARGDWQTVAGHRHVAELGYYWFRELNSDEKPDADEFAAAFAQGFGTTDEHWLWSALHKHWDPRYVEPLVRRIAEGPPANSGEADALGVILTHAAAEFGKALMALNEQAAWSRLAEIAIELADMRGRRSRNDLEFVERANLGAAMLPADFSAVSDAQVALNDQRSPKLSDAARERLSSISQPSEPIRALRLMIDAHVELPVADDVRWMLEQSDDPGNATLAIDAAVRHQMANEVEASLSHRFADVVAEALKATAEPMPAPLPGKLLELASHRGSPVRKALVKILKAKPDTAHMHTLIHLANDQWSRETGYYGEPDHFPIARDAVEALAALAPLPAYEAERLLEIGTGSSDPKVRAEAFNFLAKTGNGAIQSQLFDLAVQPGSAPVRSAAVDSLLFAVQLLDQSVAERITPPVLGTRAPRIAAPLAIIAGYRLDADTVRALANSLAEKGPRRSLILLLAYTLKDQDSGAAKEITSLLPKDHEAVRWALGGEIEEPTEALLEDLGDAVVCDQVLNYIRLSTRTGDR